MTQSQLDDLLEVCKALSNPTRLQIMGWLRDPTEHFAPQADPIEQVGVCVKQIQEKAGISQSTASQFMAVLQRAGLVESTRIGQWTYYRRSEARIAGLPELVGQSLSSGLPGELRSLIASGPMAHLTTVNPDGSPQVTVIWIGLDGDELVSGHMSWYAKLRNIARDPRVVLSFDAPREPGAFLNPYAVLGARATIEPSDAAWDLLDRLAKVYVSPDAQFPAAKGPGYIVRYSIERIGGVGPWTG